MGFTLLVVGNFMLLIDYMMMMVSVILMKLYLLDFGLERVNLILSLQWLILMLKRVAAIIDPILMMN